MYRALLAEAGLDGSYEAVLVRGGGAARAIEDFRARGYTGLNVTTPLKEEAFLCAQTHDAAASASGAVNTLLLGARIAGYNTDGIGALGALREAGLTELALARVLVLGTGPTARAVIFALVSVGALVSVWSRTRERAVQVARRFGIEPWAAELRLNAVVAALPPNARFGAGPLVDVLRLAPLVVDANYRPRATLAAILARSDIRDGTSMLQAGARASFALFRGAGSPGAGSA
ncbi:MAG: hypothetical protein GIX03_07150 [Candidatus Eremiobacteraeota bacterium]|nr:hypothetical protein [Candidatus Eremiobacteraeota bacterium]MBC5802768.1 hypothetical protein [Candidatus Eremiobacteraeota bacterium]MBC5820887.1 hypothetical protein [Candidatus Eremiobacteraeota bacterium]